MSVSTIILVALAVLIIYKVACSFFRRAAKESLEWLPDLAHHASLSQVWTGEKMSIIAVIPMNESFFRAHKQKYPQNVSFFVNSIEERITKADYDDTKDKRLKNDYLMLERYRSPENIKAAKMAERFLISSDGKPLIQWSNGERITLQHY